MTQFMMDYSQYTQTLTKVPLFANISEGELNGMLNCFRARVKAYEKEGLIANEGEDYTGIGVILSGSVIVSKVNEQGERVVLSKFTPGQMFGEMIAFSKKDKWPATVTALEKTEIISVDPSLIINTCGRMCDSHRQLIMNMLELISNKALNLNTKVEYLSKKSMRGKLAKYLLEQKQGKTAVNFDVDMNRNELADFLNVSRPSMSRELGRMKEDGLIDFHRQTFRIIHEEGLREAAQL